MNHDLERVKNDVETMQKAMGLAPAMEREWVPWMKRDKWLNLWWCLPGLILIAYSFMPAGNKVKYFGMAPGQWMGILVITAMLAMLIVAWKMTSDRNRPQSLLREYRRYWGFDSQGKRAILAMCLGCVLYFVWAWHFRVGSKAFMSGLFINMGAIYLVLSVTSRLWLLLGVAIPLLVYGLYEALFGGKGNEGISLGMMFVGIGLLGFIIQAWQVRQIERQHESH